MDARLAVRETGVPPSHFDDAPLRDDSSTKRLAEETDSASVFWSWR
jgi:hypothetical protein